MERIDTFLTDQLDLWTSAIAHKSTTGRGRSKKFSLYGIEKLRALILDLAVHGKLVPQEPEDDPAIKILEVSDRAREKLVREGSFRALPTLPPGQVTRLPSNWCAARLGQVVRVINGRAYKKNELLGFGTPVLRVGNLFTSKDWYYSDLELDADKYINNGDLIYAWSASFGPFIWRGGKVIYHYHIWKLEPYDKKSVSTEFLRLYLQNETEAIKASGHGIAMLHMTKERMERLSFALPPLSEQHRIVAKVDELMALCDWLEAGTYEAIEAHQLLVTELLATLTASRDSSELAENWARIETHFDTLFVTEDSVGQLKQTILQLAVMGRLVSQDPNDEPGADLLKRIAVDRSKISLQKTIRKTENTVGLKNYKFPFNLPAGWSLAVLKDIGLTQTGGTPKTSGSGFSGGSIPFIGPGQITPNGKMEPPEKYVNDSGLDESTEALVGDILMVCIGGSIGKSAIVSERVAFNQQLNSIRPLLIDGRYLFHVLNSYYFQQAVLDRATGSATPIINRSKWETIVVPIPPQMEQERIAAKIDELNLLCHKLQFGLLQANGFQNQLSDAVVARAVG